jgi:hypothetical protein
MPKTQQEIEQRIQRLNEEVQQLVDKADADITEVIKGKISFQYEIRAPRDVLTRYERAQSLCFVTKYDSLPEPEPVDIREYKGQFYPNNIDAFRHLLNEYRPVIQNKKDSTHFSKIHALCRQKLENEDPSVDLSITVQLEDREDITKLFLTLLDQRNKAINILAGSCEFGYIYNGILQHSDHKYTRRYIAEYASGELHYVFLKHAMVCSHVKQGLSWHYYLLKVLSRVSMGPL